MGFKTRTFKRKFEFKHWGVSHTLDHEEPGYVKTMVFNPGTQKEELKYIQKHDAVEGMVVDVEWFDRTDKKDGRRSVGYLLTMDIGDEVINLEFPYGKNSYRTLMRHGPNVDWSQVVEFSAFKTKTKQDKDANALCIWQIGPNGERAVVKSAHTLENPNGCPPAVKDDMTGEWDFKDAERWLKAQFDKVCVAAIKKAGAAHQPAAKAIAAAVGGYGDPNDPNGAYAPADGGPPYDDEPPDDYPNADDIPF